MIKVDENNKRDLPNELKVNLGKALFDCIRYIASQMGEWNKKESLNMEVSLYDKNIGLCLVRIEFTKLGENQ